MSFNFIAFDQEQFGESQDNSTYFFQNVNRIRYQDAKRDQVNYLPLHLRAPFDLQQAMAKIPNDIFLMMQQGIIRPLIIMVTEHWDLFNTFAWVQNDYDLTPDFGNVPYSEMIQHFTNRSVPEENVTWLVPMDSHIEQIDFLRRRGYKIACKFIQFDFFLETLRLTANRYELKTKTFQKHYSCLLNSTPRTHRYGMVYGLWQDKLLTYGDVSCSPYEELTETKHSNWTNDSITTDQYMSNFTDWQANKDEFVASLPLVFDNTRNQHWDMTNYDEKHIFEKCFLWIASENSIHDGVYITEKTWKPIAYGNPFCINGDVGSLKYLHKLGFQTFDKFWDESYDNDTSVDKVKKITQIVKDLCSKSLPEIQDMYNQMLPILKHNHEHLKTFTQHDDMLKNL